MSNFNYSSFLVQSADNTISSTQTPSAPVNGQRPSGGLFGNSTMIWFLLPLLLILMMASGGGSKRRQKQMQLMLKSLEKGDKVQSIGGIIGTVFHVNEKTIVIKVDENTKMEFAIEAIATVLEKKNPVAVPEQKGFMASLKERFSKKSNKEQKNSSSSPEDISK